MNTLLSFNPPVIAHRGASGYAPENTLAAFAKAAQLGIKWVEFDVMLSACGIPIIFHDETLDRTTNGRGELIDYSFPYLQSLDAGTWFNPIFAGERIPTLAQVMTFLQEMHMNANVELKPLPGEEELLAKKVLEIIPNHLIKEPSTILFSSFSIEGLFALRKQAKDCLLGLLLHDWDPDWRTLCESLQCASLHIYDEIMTEEKVHEIKNMGKAALCYTVNNPLRAKQLFGWGVDAVFSDVPDKILTLA